MKLGRLQACLWIYGTEPVRDFRGARALAVVSVAGRWGLKVHARKYDAARRWLQASARRSGTTATDSSPHSAGSIRP